MHCILSFTLLGLTSHLIQVSCTGSSPVTSQRNAVYNELFGEQQASPDDVDRTLTLLRQYEHLAGPQQRKFVKSWLAACDTSGDCNDYSRFYLSGINNDIARVMVPLMRHCGLKQFNQCKDNLRMDLKRTVSRLGKPTISFFKTLDKHFIKPHGLETATYRDFYHNETLIRTGLDSLLQSIPLMNADDDEIKDHAFKGISLRKIAKTAYICEQVVDPLGEPLSGFLKFIQFSSSAQDHLDAFVHRWLSRYNLCRALVAIERDIDAHSDRQMPDENRLKAYLEDDAGPSYEFRLNRAQMQDGEKEKRRHSGFLPSLSNLFTQ